MTSCPDGLSKDQRRVPVLKLVPFAVRKNGPAEHPSSVLLYLRLRPEGLALRLQKH